MDTYQQLCSAFYDIDKPTPPADALNFYSRIVSQAGGPVLEPMCGSGRFLIPLLERGYDVDGMDGSDCMLSACRARCAARGFNPTLQQQLLHELSVARRYKLIFVPDGSFCLITDPAEARESVRRMHAALERGGRLVIEIDRTQESASHVWPWGGRWVTRPDGARIICSWVGHFDAAQRISYSIGRYELVEGGRLLRTEFEDFNLRYYQADEFRALLEECGFEQVKTLDHYGENPSTRDGSFVFEAVRR